MIRKRTSGALINKRASLCEPAGGRAGQNAILIPLAAGGASPSATAAASVAAMRAIRPNDGRRVIQADAMQLEEAADEDDDDEEDDNTTAPTRSMMIDYWSSAGNDEFISASRCWPTIKLISYATRSASNSIRSSSADARLRARHNNLNFRLSCATRWRKFQFPLPTGRPAGSSTLSLNLRSRAGRKLFLARVHERQLAPMAA